jgi:hypothetical protein
MDGAARERPITHCRRAVEYRDRLRPRPMHCRLVVEVTRGPC